MDYTICVITSIVRRKDPCVYKIISDTLKMNKEMDTCSEVESGKKKIAKEDDTFR